MDRYELDCIELGRDTALCLLNENTGNDAVTAVIIKMRAAEAFSKYVNNGT